GGWDPRGSTGRTAACAARPPEGRGAQRRVNPPLSASFRFTGRALRGPVLWWPRRPLATLGRKPRQGRKAATVSIDAGAEASWRGHHPFLTLSCARKAGALLSWPGATGASSWRRTGWSGAVPTDAGAEARLRGRRPVLSLPCPRTAVALSRRPVATVGSCGRRGGWSGTVSIDAGAEASWRGHHPFGNRTSRERPGDSFSRPRR